MIWLYLTVLSAFGLLAVCSRRETIFTEEPVSVLQRPFEKMAIHLYRELLRRPGLAGLRRVMRPGSVREELRILDPSSGYERSEHAYFVRKIRFVLLLAFSGDCLALLLAAAGGSAGLLRNGALVRPEPWETEQSAMLTAEAETGSREQFTVLVPARSYTKEETDRMAAQALRILDKTLAGENLSLKAVSQNLEMPSSLPGFPFQITWESSNYGLVDSNGIVLNSSLPEKTRAPVELTAVLSYEGRKYEKKYQAVVEPVPLTGEDAFRHEVETALQRSQEETTERADMPLPSSAGGKMLVWTERAEDHSLSVFLLLTVLGFLSYRLEDRELHARVERRSRALQLGFPQMLSQLVLYVGAGMSVRAGFACMGENYREQRRKGGERKEVYEEILIMCHELESGVPETEAYSRFGRRCGLISYSRFCSLLAQNLRKGSSTLLLSLREEAEQAFADRKTLARQMGEEAGTKLLFPMILMLAVTMVMIMVPAYRSFSG